MRLFLDQMFRVEMAERLRTDGHDIVRAGEIGLGRADDAEVLAVAIAQQRVLVTLDGHFGDWAILPLARHGGVIRLKTEPTTTENALSVLRPLLAGRTEADFQNRLAIAAAGRVRWIRTAS